MPRLVNRTAKFALLGLAATLLTGAQPRLGDLEARLLASHNRERALAGVPPLRWNDELARGAQAIPNPVAARNPAAASLYIVPGLGRGDSWFSTHPATENRIAALEQMAGEMGLHGPPPLFDGRDRPSAPGAGTSVPKTRRSASALDPHGRRG